MSEIEVTTVTDVSTEARTSQYETMFLVSQGVASDMNACVAHIQEILDRAGVEVVAMKKWDERRLAYEIDNQKRAVYILAYYTAPTSAVAKIERSCNLSENILRQLTLNVDHLTRDEMVATDARESLAVEGKLRDQDDDRDRDHDGDDDESDE